MDFTPKKTPDPRPVPAPQLAATTPMHNPLMPWPYNLGVTMGHTSG